MTDPSTRTQKTVTAPALRAGGGTCPHITATKVQGGFWLESEVVRTDQADCSKKAADVGPGSSKVSPQDLV